ncbi:putative small integral membrane protein [Marmoricola sp. OAE513]|uniref:DUF2142 domain-containing protein n=1 Tax=Marmoricola sp. OAE513 TaxID=2817894 RepID=UPI001AE46745
MSARLRTTVLAGVGFLALQLGWILCVAPNYGIDEFDHSYRASSVALGHWEAGSEQVSADLGRGDLIPVRADVAEAARAACEARPYTRTFNCRPYETLANGEVMLASGASRYNPVFYGLVGTLAAPFHGTANLYAMRLVTALLGCALFMMTIWLTLAGARTVWPLVAGLVAALPTTVYSTAVATPNGLEMLAGLAAWVALLALVAPRGDQRRTPSYAALAVASAVLANTHTLGLLWLGLIVVAVAVVHGPVVTARALLPRGGREIAIGLATGVAIGFEIAWVLLSGVNSPSAERAIFLGNPWSAVARGIVLWPLQAIGAFPMRDEHAPALVYAVLLLVLVGMTVLAVLRRAGGGRVLLGIGFVALVSFAVPASLTVISFHQVGGAWQGRYGMPFTVGLIVLTGYLLDTDARPFPQARFAAPAVAVGLVAVQLLSQWHVMAGQRAKHALVEATHWSPPSALLLIALAAVALGCWVRATSTRPAPISPEPARAEPVLMEANR